MRPIRHMKKVVMISALLLVLTLSLGGGVASKGNDTAATYENLRLFTEVLSIVQSQYVDEVPPKDIIYNAIKGTLRASIRTPRSSIPTCTVRCRSRRAAPSAGSASRSPCATTC
jgi:carboxyl-terminal processing protease